VWTVFCFKRSSAEGREPVYREARERWMSLPGRAPPPIVVNLPPRWGD